MQRRCGRAAAAARERCRAQSRPRARHRLLRNRAAPLCQQLGLLPPLSTHKPSPSAAKQEVWRGCAGQLRIDACECIPTHLQYLAARKEREIPLVPSYQHSGERKGTWQKLLGVLYTSHLSQFTPLGKSTSPEDSSQVSPRLQGILLVCVIISIQL